MGWICIGAGKLLAEPKRWVRRNGVKGVTNMAHEPQLGQGLEDMEDMWHGIACGLQKSWLRVGC